jgi:hypothetical protein
LPPLLLKIEGGGDDSFAPFLALNLRKKIFFTIVWKHILSI